MQRFKEQDGRKTKDNFDDIGFITAPSTDQAKQWQGWGTALKPALEPIVMARKPLDGTVADNVLKHGVGGINIDGCRVETADDLNGGGYNTNGTSKKDLSNATSYATKVIDKEFIQPIGRFPANVIHDGSDEVVALFPETGVSSGGGKKANTKYGEIYGYTSKYEVGDEGYYGDSGSASRFFYTAKASQTERNWGLDGFEENETLGGGGRAKNGYDDDNDEEQRLKLVAGKYGAVKAKKKNIHPTVKPIDLMRYLVRLVTPKGGVCLDPFLGSGTTAVACKSEKFDYIGIELSQEYADIAEARIKAEVVQYDIFDILED
jgi:site-specific DNA-methyltransferase (adenine-specific)